VVARQRERTGQPPHVPAGRESHSEVEGLTRRELDILELIAHGFENHEIAERLVISTETVKSHVRHLRAKLGARNRAPAVAMGFSCRLLRWEPASPRDGARQGWGKTIRRRRVDFG
jgi:ATP/maltotriose-dependent transcriptional regulator MalT